MRFELRRAAPPPARSLLLPALLVAAAVLGVYGQAARFDFVNIDDTQLVTENRAVRTGLSATTLRWAATAIVGGNWIPLTVTSHLLDVQLFGLRPGWHHAVNVALHAANAVLLLSFLVEVTGRRAPSLVAALLSAVHPLSVEPVAWVSQRRTLLMTLLGLLALRAWARHRRRPGTRPYVAALLLFCLGCLAKPLLVTLPVLLLVLDFWPFGRWGPAAAPASGAQPGRRLALEVMPFFVAAAAFGTTALVTQADAMRLLPAIPPAGKAAHAVVSCGWYATALLWPARLAVFYPYPLAGEPAARVAAATALLSLAACAAWFARRRQPALAAGGAWFLTTLIPVSGILQAGEQAWADRYAYLPLLGVGVALAGTLPAASRLRASATATLAAAMTTVMLFAAAARNQAGHWHDAKSLLRHAIDVTEGNYFAENNLGSVLFKSGDLHGAARHFAAAVRSAPRTAAPRRNLGLVRVAQGNFAAAAEEFRAAVRENPGDASAHRDLGRALDELGCPALALEVCREALRVDPTDAVTVQLLARLLAAARSVPPAEREQATRWPLSAPEPAPTTPPAACTSSSRSLRRSAR